MDQRFSPELTVSPDTSKNFSPLKPPTLSNKLKIPSLLFAAALSTAVVLSPQNPPGFRCEKAGDVITVFGGNQLALYQNELGYDCKPIKNPNTA